MILRAHYFFELREKFIEVGGHTKKKHFLSPQGVKIIKALIRGKSVDSFSSLSSIVIMVISALFCWAHSYALNREGNARSGRCFQISSGSLLFPSLCHSRPLSLRIYHSKFNDWPAAVAESASSSNALAAAKKAGAIYICCWLATGRDHEIGDIRVTENTDDAAST